MTLRPLGLHQADRIASRFPLRDSIWPERDGSRIASVLLCQRSQIDAQLRLQKVERILTADNN